MSSSTSSRQKPPSVPSTGSLNRATSQRSNRPPPPINTVVTSPPWARDEPPSPKDQTSFVDVHNAADSRPSDQTSLRSNASNLGSRWWAFTLPRPREPSPTTSSPEKSERKGFKDRSMSWLPTSSSIREGTSFARKEKEKDADAAAEGGSRRNWNLSITLPSPTPAFAPFTMAQSNTPGWDSPWTPRPNARARESSYGLEDHEEVQQEDNKHLSVWGARKKKLRSFLLVNTYVPLLFRFINISFTAAALGIAIRIRQLESDNHAMGAVGSSPTVVIIFAPLTLVHVMVAIYLEYFGRPLGLWRTSAKLAHTLSEVLFICAWSAALSLCFDNFFTSLVPCASPSSISWYNELPRPPSGIPNFEGAVGDRVCDDQITLICLVGVGLLVYCTNLVISLFRIFEKVKYHPAAPLRLP